MAFKVPKRALWPFFPSFGPKMADFEEFKSNETYRFDECNHEESIA